MNYNYGLKEGDEVVYEESSAQGTILEIGDNDLVLVDWGMNTSWIDHRNLQSPDQ